MPSSSVLARKLLSIAVLPALALACSPVPEAPQAAPETQPAATPTVASPASTPVANTVVPPPTAPAGCDVSLLSTRQKLAQLLTVGVRDAADARSVVNNSQVGGIFIGSWTDLSMLDGPLQEIAAAAGPLPLAVTVDEEGGRVQRLSSRIGPQPSPRELAQTETPEQVYQIALQRGQAMRGLGITVDFAPVVDLTDADADGVIGDRSFGSDPQTVIEYAGAYARGLRDAGLLPVLKHYPGHGRASGDSHTGAVTTPPLAELQAADLVPYGPLTSQGAVAVMVGHMEVPDLTGSDPASLSPAAYNELRGTPFGGLVYTDDLSSMGAISQRYGVAEAVLKALQAGADVALWVSTDEVPAVLDRLEQAVESGELPIARVDESVRRVASAKGC